MKTLTALTAVAALIAGISVASAQGSSMGKVTGTGKYCLKDAKGALKCTYASLSACQKANKGKTCEANPNETTGSTSK